MTFLKLSSDDQMDEQEADALFSFLERRLPASPPADRDDDRLAG
jgi:hypothetical protein